MLDQQKINKNKVFRYISLDLLFIIISIIIIIYYYYYYYFITF